MFRPPAFTPGMLPREPVIQRVVCLDAARVRTELANLEQVLRNLLAFFTQVEMDLVAEAGLLDQRELARFVESADRGFSQARSGIPIAQALA